MVNASEVAHKVDTDSSKYLPPEGIQEKKYSKYKVIGHVLIPHEFVPFNKNIHSYPFYCIPIT